MNQDSYNILVTGACSDIAQAVLKQFCLKSKSRFFLVARNLEQLNKVSDSLKVLGSLSVDCFQSELDLQGVKQNCQTIIQQAVSKMGSVDVFFAAQGVGYNSQIVEQDSTKLAQMIEVNFTAIIVLCNQISALFKQQHHGRIAVISSVAADRGRPSNYGYGASKAALATYLEGLRASMFKYNVGVTCIKPGIIQTKMTSDLKKGLLTSTTDKISYKIYQAIIKSKSTVYVPGWWRLIMWVIRNIPEPIFKRLNI